MGKSSLGSQLSYLASMNAGVSKNDFNNPFDEDSSIPAVAIESTVKNIKETKQKKKKDRFTKAMEKTDKLIADICDDETIFEFDEYISNYFTNDEDVTLRNNLINMGKKYNRDSSSSPESSEISKSFSSNEKTLTNLFDEISKDKIALQKDIDSLRMSRVKNYKNLAELIAAKNQLVNASLQIVKESVSIKKTQFDLQHKLNAKKAESEENGASSSRAISNLFSIGRSNILSSVGGYESVSTSTGEVEQVSVPVSSNIYDDDDEIIQQKYFSDNTMQNDGDKFLKYENMGVEYILLVGDEGYKQIIAEDKNGEIVTDYPMPSNVNELNFNISESTGTATDDYHRRYKVRFLTSESNEE